MCFDTTTTSPAPTKAPDTKLLVHTKRHFKPLSRPVTLKSFRTYLAKSQAGPDQRRAAKLQRKYAAGQLNQTEAIIGFLEVALDTRVRR